MFLAVSQAIRAVVNHLTRMSRRGNACGIGGAPCESLEMRRHFAVTCSQVSGNDYRCDGTSGADSVSIYMWSGHLAVLEGITLRLNQYGVTSLNFYGDDGGDTVTLQNSLDATVWIYVYGEGGADVLTGSDRDSGGNAYEQFFGGDGDDTISANGGNDYVLAGNGNDSILGGDGNDSLYGGANDEVYGQAGSDYVIGDDDSDFLDGGADADSISGGAGNDILVGDATSGAEYADGGDGPTNSGTSTTGTIRTPSSATGSTR